MLRSTSAILLSSLVSAGALSCSVYSAPACQVGSDCASGICDADGTCGAAPTGSSSGSGTASSSTSSGGTGTGGSAGCSTGGSTVMITRQQVPLQPGLHANFLAAENATVSTAGTMNTDGSRTWDLSVTFSGDHAEAVDTLALPGQWFGGDFTGDSYAARLADSSTLLGVFLLTDTAIELVGVASPTSGSTQTELHYAPAVTVLSFPLQMGSTWSTNATVTGEADGVTVLYSEGYQSQVDAYGTLKTPYATFPVLRVNTLLTRVVGALVTTTRTYAFVTACFGNVANIVSNTDEPTVEFTTAAEVTRLEP
jgi:hypothetical protein